MSDIQSLIGLFEGLQAEAAKSKGGQSVVTYSVNSGDWRNILTAMVEANPELVPNQNAVVKPQGAVRDGKIQSVVLLSMKSRKGQFTLYRSGKLVITGSLVDPFAVE